MAAVAVVAVVAGCAVWAYTSGWAGTGNEPAPSPPASPGAGPALEPDGSASGWTRAAAPAGEASVDPVHASAGVINPSAGAAGVSAGVSAGPNHGPSGPGSASPGPSAPGPGGASKTAASKTAAAKGNPGGANLALAGVATASESEGDAWAPRHAIDGDPSTRWSSGFADRQWLRVDLKQLWQISEVALVWEAAYGVGYRVESSADGKKWTTLYETSAGKGGTVRVDVGGQVARHIRMNGTKRSGSYGYSLLEVEIR